MTLVDVGMVGRALALTAGLAFALSSLFTRLGLRHSNASTGVFVSFVVNGLVFAVWVTALGAWVGTPWRAVAWFVVAGLVAPALARTLAYTAMRHVGASVSVPIVASEPIFAMVFAVTVFAQPVDPSAWIGIAVIVAGVVMLSLQHSHHAGSLSATTPRVRIGLHVGTALLAAAAYGLAMNLRQVGLEIDPRPLVGAAIGAMTSLIAYPLVMMPLQGATSPFVWEARSLRWFLIAAACLVVASYTLFSSLALVPAPVASALTSVRVLLVPILGALFLRDLERVTPAVVAGAVLVFVGVVLT